MSTCNCGCGSVTTLTKAQDPCDCGCDCCDTQTLDREEEIAGLREIREAADRRLSELGAG